MKPVFLLAHQRSGTNALRSALQQSRHVEDFGEAFNPNGTKYAANYFHFLRLDENHKLMNPGNNVSRFLEFYKYLVNLADKKIGIVDAKYDCLQLFNSEVHELSAPPTIFSLIEQVGASVIHLTRNAFHVYVSHRFAVESLTWHKSVHDSAEQASVALTIDLDDMLDYVGKRSREREAVQAHLAVCSHVLTIDYTELFPIDGDATCKPIWTFLGLSPQPYTPQLKKSIQTPLPELILNYADVEKAMRDNGWGALLD